MKTLLEAWQACATRQPQVFAVRTSGGDLTYAELQQRSLRLATGLRMFRGGDAVVALPYGPGYFVALHACMRAGVTSLPLDLSLPDEMLKSQLLRLNYACVISEGRHAERLGLSTGCVLRYETAGENDPSIEHQECNESADGLIDLPLYRAFTSGSSGQQSLVTVDHKSFAHYANKDKDDDLFNTPTEVRCCVASHVSSMQIGTFWRAVTNGDTYVSIDPRAGGLASSAARLLAVQPGIISGFPSLLGHLFDAIRPSGKLTGTHTMSITGEPLKPAWIRAHIDLMPGLKTIAYGYSSTEAMLVAGWSGSPQEFLSYQRVPAGFPEAGKQVLVVDENGDPVPAGEIGEIVVRSAFVCSDIQGRDAASRLDLGESGDVRTYRTRDLGRFMPNGMIECLGRLDRQCKINGVRIDPLIVEQCLESHPDVDLCVVSSVDHEGVHLLVAAYVSHTELGIDVLRKHMNAMLPSAHQPSILLWFDALPKTERGKLALGEIDLMIKERLQVHQQVEGLPLQTPTEHTLADIWSTILGKRIVSRRSDFFNLGGHSLAVLQLLDRISSHWGIRPEISAVFMNSTLESVAGLIDTMIAPIRSNAMELTVTPVKVWDTGKGQYIFAFVGGAGSEEEFTKYHLIGRVMGDAWRIHLLPDPQTSKGLFPNIGLDQLREMYARVLMPYCNQGKVWLLGDCIGGPDAFAVACALQTQGVQHIGVIHMDSAVPSKMPELKGDKQKGLEAYRRLPQDTGLLREGLFRLFLRLAWFPKLKALFHLRPCSRKQVFSMALAYGLFDPHDYAKRCPDAGSDAAGIFHHYLEKGWAEREPPSGRFNAYRYAKHVPDFDIDSDEPVVHALLSGFRDHYPRRRLLAYMESPNVKSDLMHARIHIRQYHPMHKRFKGELDVIISEDFPEELGAARWGQYVDGNVHVHRVEGDHRSYLKENLYETARAILRILESRS